MVGHLDDAVHNQTRCLEIGVGELLDVDRHRQVELSAVDRVDEVEALDIARCVEAEEVVGSDLEPCFTSLADIVDKLPVLERSSLGGLDYDKLYAFVPDLVKVDVAVVGADVYAHDVMFAESGDGV